MASTEVNRGPSPSLHKMNNKFSTRYLIPSTQNYQTQRYIKSLNMLLKERKRYYQVPDNVIIHPLSTFRMYWEIVLFNAYLIHYFICPVYFAFYFDRVFLMFSGWDAVILISKIVFILDIYITFNTGYYDSYEKTIVLNKNVISNHYMKGFLMPDVVSSVPLDFLVVVTGLDPKYYNYSQITNIVRLVRFPTFLKYFNNIAEMVTRNRIPKRFTQHLMIFLFLMNFSACCYNTMGTIFDDIEKEAEHIQTNTEEPSEELKYFLCILFTFSSITTAGYGILLPVKIFEMVAMLMVMLVHGFYKLYMCAFFSDELRGIKTVSNQYLEMKNEIEQYMQHKQLPIETQKRFLEYFNFRYQQKYFREKKLMSTLTENLRSEVIYHTYANVINSPIFEHVSRELMGKIISRLHYEVYLPSDIITRSGTVGSCMYFILRGTLAVYTSSGKETFHLDDGDYFGELCLIMDGKRVETTVALEVSELLRMDKKDFRELIASDENLFKAMEMGATEKINKTLISDKMRRRSHSIFS